MSAYIVNPETLQTVMDALYRSAWLRECTTLYGLLDGTKIDARALAESRGGYQSLASELHALNVAGVCQRYGDKPETMIKCPKLSPGIAPDPVQAYKSLQCLIYQCSEGSAMETQLYRDLVKIENHLARNIVGHLPEYNAAKWG